MILGCKSPSEPAENPQKWENITSNLQGEKLTGLKEYKGELYLSTYTGIYKYENNSWVKYLNSSPYFIADFEFKEDTLFILSDNHKVLYKNQNDSLIIKKSVDRSILQANDLCFNGDDIFIGGNSQGPFRNGLIGFIGDSAISYKMNNYFAEYSVDNVLLHKNLIFVGTSLASDYFVAKLENGNLESIGLGPNRYGIGECYSMISYKDKLLVGSGGEILAYENNQWSVYKKKLPGIQNTELEDKAISLFAKDTTLYVGTLNNGILIFDEKLNEWNKSFTEGLPQNLAINEIICVNNKMFVLLGQYDWQDTFSNYIYIKNLSN